MSTAILYYSKSDFEVEKLIQNIDGICQKYGLTCIPIEIDRINGKENISIKHTPSLVVGPYNLKFPFTLSDVEIAVSAVAKKPEITSKSSIKNIKTKNAIGIFLSKFYPSVIAFILIIFVGGSIAAPFLMFKGKVKFANSIYSIYSIFCHQLAFRSIFINGEQSFYPRELAHIKNLTTYESEFNDPSINVDLARKIVGNQGAGYKIALCERDLAIYSSLALLAIIFQLSGRKIKPIRWYIWFIIGLIPIGIDGFSQIPGLSAGWPAWLPIRESTPFLRILTGSLFGGMTGWYMLPLMEESMQDTHQQLIVQREIIRATLEDKKKNEKSKFEQS